MLACIPAQIWSVPYKDLAPPRAIVDLPAASGITHCQPLASSTLPTIGVEDHQRGADDLGHKVAVCSREPARVEVLEQTARVNASRRYQTQKGLRAGRAQPFFELLVVVVQAAQIGAHVVDPLVHAIHQRTARGSFPAGPAGKGITRRQAPAG